MAITWKNVNAPNFSSANSLSVAGGDRITQGIQGLRDLADGQANRATQEIDELNTRNTEDVLGQISQLTSMEDYENALSSGQFDTKSLREQYGNGIDVSAIRNALLNQDNVIRNDEMEEFEYNRAVTTRKDTPFLDSFNASLQGATTPDQVNKLVQDISSNETLSNAGKATAIAAANEFKQSLLDAEFNQKNRANTLTEQENKLSLFPLQKETADLALKSGLFDLDSAVASRAQREKDTFLANYNPKMTRNVGLASTGEVVTEEYFPKQEIENQITSASQSLQDLDTKYPLPENFADVISSGTASDAVAEYVNGLDSEEVDVADVNDTLLSSMKEQTWKDAEGRDVTFSSLPKWVVKQSLQNVVLDNSWDFGDWGRADLSESDKTKINKAIEQNLKTYGTLTARKKAKDAERLLHQTRLNNAQRNKLLFQERALEAYENRKNPNI